MGARRHVGGKIGVGSAKVARCGGFVSVSPRRPPDSRQLVELYALGVRVGSTFRKLPAVGDRVPLGRGRSAVVNAVEPGVHPDDGPARVARAYVVLSPRPDPSK